jgi:hypothetical protein
MDPPDLFPYKQPQMEKVFTAFEMMLRRAAEQPKLARVKAPPLAPGRVATELSELPK